MSQRVLDLFVRRGDFRRLAGGIDHGTEIDTNRVEHLQRNTAGQDLLIENGAQNDGNRQEQQRVNDDLQAYRKIVQFPLHFMEKLPGPKEYLAVHLFPAPGRRTLRSG